VRSTTCESPKRMNTISLAKLYRPRKMSSIDPHDRA
jgi:hypothetical protein